MRLRGLLIGAVVLAGLAAGLYFSNKQKSAEAAKPPASTDTSPKILTLTEGDITKIALKKKGADATVLEKDNAGKWQLTAPSHYLADQDAVGQLASSAAAVSSDRLGADKVSDTAADGIQSPAVQVVINTKDRKTHR